MAAGLAHAAETGSLWGWITDADQGPLVPVWGAAIEIDGTELGATSDDSGYYMIKDIPAGTWSVTVSAIGYDRVRDSNIVIAAGAARKLNLGMHSHDQGPQFSPEPLRPANTHAAIAEGGLRNLGPTGRPGRLDTTEVQNPEILHLLQSDEVSRFAHDGIIGLTTDFNQFADIYEQIERESLPILVTTDPMFHSFHVLFDCALRTLEERYMYSFVQRMLQGMLRFELGRLDSAHSDNIRDALRRNIAWLAVPLSYLDSTYAIPRLVSAEVAGERALIEAHAGFATSGITETEQDFSLYIPRGHYTRSARLMRYFRAITYLSGTTFYLRTRGDPDLALQLMRQALLLTDALDKAETDSGPSPSRLWARVRRLQDCLVGTAETLTPEDYLAAGVPVNGLEYLANDSNIRQVIAWAESLYVPTMVSGRLYRGQPKADLRGMTFLGRSLLLDASILQELVYDRIGTDLEPRLLPMGLDVMAVLGSERAREILISEYGQDRYSGYVEKLDSLRDEFAVRSLSDWNRDVTRAWLYAVKLNLEPVSRLSTQSNVAEFTQSRVYPDKTLMAACGSWTEQRHDVILYAQQTNVLITGMPTWYHGRPIPQPKYVAYVEPKPEVFQQLARIASDLSERLRDNDAVVPEVDDKLHEFSRSAQILADIASGELKGAEITESDANFCRFFGAELENLVKLPAGVSDRLTDRNMAIVADVATDPNRNLVLEEATGAPCLVLAVIPFYGEHHVAAGACYSYYEFVKPQSERMTDEQWQQTLSTGPAMPVWTKTLIQR